MKTIEKASQAVYLLGPPDPDTDEPPERWFIPHVIAALQALKDPDEGTVEAMCKAAGFHPDESEGQMMRSSFNAALDHIIKGGSE